MENITYEYVQLEQHEEQYDQISLHEPEGGKKFIRLNADITKYLQDHSLEWVRIKKGDDSTVFMEFVEEEDGEYTTAVDLNPLTKLPAMIINDKAYDYIAGLLEEEVECGTKVNISENLTPWVAPVPVTKNVEATSEETVTEGTLLTFDAEELLGHKFKVNNTLVNAQAKLVTTDIAEVETETALVLGENEIDLTDDDIESYTLTLFNESGYEIEYTYTPAPDPCVATYQIYYSDDKHI